ncbi:hypothetical protein H0H81_011235 [Sphagnurus paluster]|uniref:Uncharacterized protein n=1 Tax=Sphagnurus paluster TaxID=117069 RepID=A0A9P7GK33_9AGAR|nr:hypothetical protein H0H81_011235 [Sphagnurus paluster]
MRTSRHGYSSAADISRILDPIYASPNAHASTSACVDSDGELHDPDFRCFPLSHHDSEHERTSQFAAYKKATRPCWEYCPYDETEEVEFDDAHTTKKHSYKQRYPAYHNDSPPASFVEHREEEESTLEPVRSVKHILERTKREFRSRFSIHGDDSQADFISSPTQTPPAYDWTRTYDYKARRQWAVIDEHVRLSIFRAKKRLRHCIAQI